MLFIEITIILLSICALTQRTEYTVYLKLINSKMFCAFSPLFQITPGEMTKKRLKRAILKRY